MDEFSPEWVRQRLRECGLKQTDLAEKLGIEQHKVSKSLAGRRRFTAQEAIAIQQILGSKPTAVSGLGAAGHLITVYDVAASAGTGALVASEDDAGYSLAFPPDYLRRLTRSHPRNLAIISVKGDSMEPTLHDDDLVMLDTSKRDPHFDGLFVLRFGETLHVKRVARSARKDHVKIISDNRVIYPAEDMHLRDIEVVGKVIWKGGKV